jgi:glycosyltransferase involved in cell wall biosynthesis
MESLIKIQNDIGKPTCAILGPVQARAGYGNMARDISTMLIRSGRYNVKILPLPWGNCPLDALDPNNKDHKDILDRLILHEGNMQQPDISIVVSIPTEFKRIGKYSIGYTAGIETNAMSPQWVEACNQMDLVLTISEHSKLVAVETGYEARNKDTNEVINVLKMTKPVEIIHPVLYTDVVRKIADNDVASSVRHIMKNVDEKFNFLFVGHWLNGEIGEDRKNVGLLVRLFLETFKDRRHKPGLILKTNSATFSILDRENTMNKINQIKATVNSTDLPSIYLIHGDLTDNEMNSLYNHPKVKAHISLTKGEGFGIPLLEATISQKPIIASGWSGHVDFLDKAKFTTIY